MATAPPPPLSSPGPTPFSTETASFTQSITQLKDLSSSISAFHQSYDDLINHLQSIRSALLSKLPPEMSILPPLTPQITPPPPPEQFSPIPILNSEITIPPPTEQFNPVPIPIPNSNSNSEITILHPASSESVPTEQSDKIPPKSEIEGLSDRIPPKSSEIEGLSDKFPPKKSEIEGLSDEIPPKNSEIEGLSDKIPPKSEIEGLCKGMNGKGVKRYLMANLADLDKLREEVPKALRLASSPARVVLDCVGKFFSQGSKAFAKRDSPVVQSREASIFALECFLLMMGGGGVVVERSVRHEAEASAAAWKKRLVVEGGVAKSGQVDARGLLMFVACFGIPGSFRREDVRDLIVAANAKEIVGLLRNSRVLMDKIPDSLAELQATSRCSKQDYSIKELESQRNLKINGFTPIKPLCQREEGENSPQRKSRPRLDQARIDSKALNFDEWTSEFAEPVHKKARIDSSHPSLNYKTKGRQMLRRSPLLSSGEDNSLSKVGCPCQSTLEEMMSKEDWDGVESSYKLVEKILFDEPHKHLGSGKDSIPQIGMAQSNFKMFFNVLLLKIKRDAEKICHLEGQLQESKKENGKLGVKIESLIDARDQLLETRQFDLEHARAEGITNFLDSSEGKKTLDDALGKQLTAFKKSQEYRDELTHRAATLYVKGFDVCRQQLLNSQRLPLDFDLSFLDIRADERGNLVKGFDASSEEWCYSDF